MLILMVAEMGDGLKMKLKFPTSADLLSPQTCLIVGANSFPPCLGKCFEGTCRYVWWGSGSSDRNKIGTVENRKVLRCSSVNHGTPALHPPICPSSLFTPWLHVHHACHFDTFTANNRRRASFLDYFVSRLLYTVFTSPRPCPQLPLIRTVKKYVHTL